MRKEKFWDSAIKQSDYAILNKSLVPLTTNLNYLTDSHNHKFEIRELTTKFSLQNNYFGPKQNPFRPWDVNLEISRIGNTHELILNKYPVQKGHMLLITVDWYPQDGWLTLSDWNSLLIVDKDTTGLWFYNSGPKAGASQPHRHLQLLRRQEGTLYCPRDYWFKMQLNSSDSRRNTLSRACSVIELDKTTRNDPNKIYKKYLELCLNLGIGSPEHNNKPLKPYNMLLTDGWLCLVRRTKESSYGFSINSLGFAGYLLITNESSVKHLNENGPEKLLESVVN